MPSSVFEQSGGELIDPPTLMDASIPLELSGEAVRARLCIFTDANGREQALRPDLTLPVAIEEAERLKAGGSGPRRYRYNARAYRLPSAPGQALEFSQLGVEQFGAPSAPQADAELFGQVAEAAQAGGAAEGSASFGDLAVFPAFVDALELGDAVSSALKRAFRQAGGVAALLKADQGTAKPGLAAALVGASREDAEATVRNVLGVSGIETIGARSLEEIVDGLMTKAASVKAGGIPNDAVKVLEEVLGVEEAPERVAGTLSSIAKSAALTGLDPTIERLATRMDLITKAAPKFLGNARFGTPFGRRFNYYDGFLFELTAKDAPESAPFAAGGRYDSLIEKLSGGVVNTNGIGGVVRPDRLEIAS